MKLTQVAKACAAGVAGLLAASCSGILPSPGQGYVVSPAYLGRYATGGSMSTLWYRGSDARYHHFSHLYLVSTKYRIKRSNLTWPREFPLDARDPVLASPFFARSYPPDLD